MEKLLKMIKPLLNKKMVYVVLLLGIFGSIQVTNIEEAKIAKELHDLVLIISSIN
jgi:hypothetical protein